MAALRKERVLLRLFDGGKFVLDIVYDARGCHEKWDDTRLPEARTPTGMAGHLITTSLV